MNKAFGLRAARAFSPTVLARHGPSPLETAAPKGEEKLLCSMLYAKLIFP